MNRHCRRLELDKILADAAEYAVLEGGKARLAACEPTSSLAEANALLDVTGEASRLLFELGSGGVEYFPPLGELAERAEKGAVLSCGELRSVSRLLASARLCFRSVQSLGDERVPRMRELTSRLVFDEGLEEDIAKKIVSDTEIADTASERLFSLRREIRALGERIRARLGQYLSGEERKMLQDGIVTMRGDRYVIPVKAEYKRSVKGFVHDRSATGATVFIEPEEVLEMNNELRSLVLDEREEEERILAELSARVGSMRGELERDEELLGEADSFYARAEYCYKTGCVRPALNGKGILDIRKGRHPLLERKTAIPVSVGLGEGYDFLLISGANTGGKTVTLKMCGLFCLMAACGLFVPAAEGTRLACFSGVFCDIGDSQSIEENLSTFSSHILNIKEILEEAGENSLVLIDEPGGGTDPEEGQALARAVLVSLRERGCRGIVTTHFSALKEFAYGEDGMRNACMEFDAEDFRPLYRLKIGAPGSSNALAICTRLGLPEETVEAARGFLSEGAQSFERTLMAAERERVAAQAAKDEAERVRAEWNARLKALEGEEKKLAAEKEKLQYSARAQAKRIIAERTARAEELLGEIEEIFARENVTESDLIRARTLKNEMGREDAEEEAPVRSEPVDPEKLGAGDRVFVGTLSAEGVVLSVRKERGTAEVQVGNLRVTSKIADLFRPAAKREEKKGVQVVRNLKERELPRECNVIGMTVQEALPEVEAFLDSALVAGMAEVRIVHGMGTGKLRSAIHAFLRSHRRVESFRLGKYGEGESGVTVVTLR